MIYNYSANNSLWVIVALVSFELTTVSAYVPNWITPKKSLLLRLLITAKAASLTNVICAPFMDPDKSISRITFLAPEVAATYHGLNRGS